MISPSPNGSSKGGRRHRAYGSRGGVHPGSGISAPEMGATAFVRGLPTTGGTKNRDADDDRAELLSLGAKVRALQEKMITVCAWSRKIEHEGEWVTFEEFLSRVFNIPSSHGMSPPAFEEVMAQLRAEIASEARK